MIANYFKIAIRNLVRNRFYSFINIFGLGLGLACVFLILQYLRQELSYDRFHESAENIYRVSWEDENPQTRTPHPLAQAMVHDFPEVEVAVSLTPMWGAGLTKETFSIGNPEKDIRFDELNVLAVDTTFFDVFTFPLEKGNPKNALKKMGGLLISSSMAKKYFGDEDPLGKRLTVNNDKQQVEVTGVFADVPVASHFHFDFLLSYVTVKALESPDSQFFMWSDFGHYNYIRLKPGADAPRLEAKMADWLRQYIDVSDEYFRSMKLKNFGFRLQPLTDIHLRSHLRWELESNGYISYIYMMTAAAILILVIGCANFINLTTAQSADRAKEIGIRKTLGAFRRQLAFQFTGESLMVSLLATFVAVILIEISIPFFSGITGQSFHINYFFFVLVLGGMGVLTGVVAGAFPSLYLSAAKPGLILKGNFLKSSGGTGIRQVFTIFQFFASMVLITTSIIIYHQLSFIQNKYLGFSKEEIIIIPINNRRAINPKAEELKTEIMRVPGVTSVSAASNIPGRSFNQHPVYASQEPQQVIASSEDMIDEDFFRVMGIDLVEGRTFSKENPADREAFIINETAAKNLFSGSAVGKELSWDRDEDLIKGQVIGVVKDFNFQSLHQAVKPLIFRLEPSYSYVVVKLNTSDLGTTITGIEKAWKQFDNRFTFGFSFLSDQLTQQYALEKNMGAILGTFSGIAILIACFGLLGIASLTFRQRTKEVSIRKVLGASVAGLFALLLKDFTRMIIIALVLAVPVVLWIMDGWLENFTFRTNIEPMIFVGSGLLLLMTAWITLGYLTLQVAKTNPAETLKNE